MRIRATTALMAAIRRLTGAAADGAGATPDQERLPGTGTAELAAEAAAAQAAAALVDAALVDADDAIRTSEQELGFATAKFGEHATAPFSAALGSARAELSAAVRVALQLDRDTPAPEATIRTYASDITAHCAAASRLLDEQSEAFDRLQDLEARAPRLAAEVDAHVAQQTARISRSGQILERLVGRYTAGAVVAVMTNPDQAAERLEFAAHSLASARQDLADERRGHAAVLLQAAEAGADQATDLLDAVEHLEAELTQAASALPAALRELTAEIAEAAALPAEPGQDERAIAVARAQAAADEIRAQQAAGPIDALAALRDVQQADAALDHVLASIRAEPYRRERAIALLDQAMLVARSSVTAAEDGIRTRRGAVGAPARTRLMEAQRHFRETISHAQNDPEAALAEAQQADALALDARALAEQDVARFDHRLGTDSHLVEATGGADKFGAQVGSAVLGGILIVSPLRNGGDSDGQDIDAQDIDAHDIDAHDIDAQDIDALCIGPGSFGGTGTRARHLGCGEHRALAGLPGSR